MKSKPKPTTFWDRYTSNFKIIRDSGNIKMIPEMDDVFCCPLCLQVFNRDHLKNKFVTLEHVPPESLGGKPLTLTCSDCNNKSGDQLDHHLLKSLQHRDFWSGESEVETDVLLRLDKSEVSATISNSDNILQVTVSPERSNPEHVKSLIKSIEINPQPTFTLKFRGFSVWYSQLALLRIAYLYAFSVFGYSFIAATALNIISDQLKNPKNRMRETWGVFIQEFPDEYLGVNIVTHPIELQSILVVFDLVTSGTRKRFGVMLPGQRKPKTDLYTSIKDKLGKQYDVSVTHIDETTIDFNVEPFALGKIWYELGLN